MGYPDCVNGRCYIPSGTFKMGSPEGVGEDDEHPQRTITVSPFWLDKNERTIGQYRRYLQDVKAKLDALTAGPAMFGIERPKALYDIYDKHVDEVFSFPENKKGDDYPVVGLTYNEAEAVCESEGGHLMTEAQYERAARGVSGRDEFGTPRDKAIIYDNGYEGAEPVGDPNDERCNSFGVCDLAGNLWERIRDRYQGNFYSVMPDNDPYNPVTGAEGEPVVFRGGSFFFDQWFARAAYRGFDFPVYRNYFFVGFRCARSSAPGLPKK